MTKYVTLMQKKKAERKKEKTNQNRGDINRQYGLIDMKKNEEYTKQCAEAALLGQQVHKEKKFLKLSQ